MTWLLPCSELSPSLKGAAVSQIQTPSEPSGSVLLVSPATQTPSEAMRASGDLVEIVACLSRNDQCVNRVEVSRVLFRPQVFGGME